jgi:transcriptional regulator with XRE-family HTH domain
LDAEPTSLSRLLHEIMDRRGYKTLTELSRHTEVPYQTLWTWERNTRALKQPPTERVLKKLAADFGMPESVVYHAAGRTWAGAGSADLDPMSLEIAEIARGLDGEARARFARIAALYKNMTPSNQAVAESVLRGVAEPR